MRPAVRRTLFAVTAAMLAGVSAFLVLLGVDIYLHGRYEKSAGFNVWGYRGAPAGRKRADEYRVVVLGGSAAYGYGVTADEAMPAVLERRLRQRTRSPYFTVLNLAYNNEGAYSFTSTLDDYASLRYDLAFLYEGYNDLSPLTNFQVFRHDSPVFRLTGYMPIFPIVFKEKAAAILSGGDPGALYRKGPTEFHAGMAARAGAGVLNATAGVAQSLEAQLGRVSTEPAPSAGDASGTGCGQWSVYCASLGRAIQLARTRGAQVIVATQPYLQAGEESGRRHRSQQAALREFLSRRFSSDLDVRYLDLSTAIDLEDPHMAFDHMHLRTAGNERLAAAIVDPVLELAARRKIGA
jgi:lysophospholipase L1-like esterase